MFGLMPFRKERTRPALPIRFEGDPFSLLRRELDLLLGRFPGGVPEMIEREYPWGLTVEALEKEVVIRAEAPGFEVGDFDIHLAGDVLTLYAEHKEEKGKEGEVEAEKRCIYLSRSLTLPPGVDAAKIEAIYRNGVLEVHLPWTPEAMGRRIEVKT
jgi:HSP20 family protein